MPAFVQVEGDRAGAEALGILVPPGHRTLVILRPRALRWDVLLTRADGSLLELRRDLADEMTGKLVQALEAWSCGGPGGVAAQAADGGYQVRGQAGDFTFVVCQRVPGQPYRPMTFATEIEAQAEAAKLTPILRPTANANQEFYFNTRHFAR